jgi:hypothetical protein
MLVGLATADDRPWHEGKTVRAAFAARGAVLMHLDAGDATVVSNPEATEIVVTTETKSADKLDKIKATIRVTGGNYAEIHVEGPKDFRYKIEVPTATRLKVRMSAGDLNIDGVDGETDVELHAGDCNIALAGAADSFGPIDLSVGAGDISAGPFSASKSGLFRHFRNDKESKYRFHAHVGAGDLNVK